MGEGVRVTVTPLPLFRNFFLPKKLILFVLDHSKMFAFTMEQGRAFLILAMLNQEREGD